MASQGLEGKQADKLSVADALKLIHELQIHQKELELKLRRTEDALTYSEARFQQIFDTIQEGVVIINSDGNISQCNNATLSILDLSLAQLKGESATDPKWKTFREDGTVFPMEDQPGIVALRTGKDSSATLYLQLPAGTSRVLEVKATAFNLVSESGEKTTERNVLVTFSDVTEPKKAEKALRENEQFIRTISDNLTSMVGYWTSDLRCTFANTEYEKWFNRTHYQMLGIRIQELMGNELFLKNEPYIRAVLRGEHQQFERELINVKGEKRFTLAQYIPHKSGDKVLGFIALITDITKIKEAEIELRKSEERLIRDNQLLEESQSIAKLGGWELNVNTRELYWTAETYRIHDTSPEEFNPTVDAGVGYFLPESKKTITEALEKALTQGAGYDLYLETYTTKGRKIDVRTTCIVTMVDGKPTKLTGIFQDITEQNQIEEKLQITNTRLQLATRVAKIGIWDRDLITGITFWDEVMLSMHGLEDRERDINNNENWRNILHPDDRKRVIEEYGNIIKEGKTFNIEYRVVWKNGSIHHLKSDAIIQRDPNGKALRIIGTVIDVTDNRLNESNLKTSENRLRTIIENEPECVKIIDKNGHLLEMNTAGLAMLDADSLQQVKSHKLINFIKPDYRVAFGDLHKKVMNGENGKLEFEIISLKGKVRWLQTHAVPIRDENSKVDFLLGITRDVTEQNQAKIELEESEAKYRLLYEANLLPMAIFETESLQFLSVNNAFVEKYGFTKEEFLSMSILDIRPESEIEIAKKAVQKEHQGVANIGTFTHRKKNGDLLQVEILRNNIIFDGKKSKFVVINDVTQRNQAEEALRKSEERFRILFDQAAAGVAQIETSSGKCVKVNKKYADIFGYTIEEVLHMDFQTITFPSDLKKDLKNMESLKAGEITEFAMEKRYFHKNGNIIWINLSVSAMWKKGAEPDFHIAVISDITQQKLAEQEILLLNNSLENKIAQRTKELALANQELIAQNEEIKRQAIELVIAKDRAEESERLKSAFLANMSHEIRTPMNGILGLAEILKKPNLSIEKQQQFIGLMEKSGERMLNIINNIINISKIESGGMNVSVSKTNINEQMDFIYGFFKQEADKKGILISLTKTLPENQSVINTDREKVYAVLTNLIKNAIKFTQSGTVEFGCTIKPVELGTGQEELYFFVKDTGKGIHPHQLDLIFERFRQADESTNNEGAGLGLTISKSYIEMLKGRIWVESEFGKGSTFYFTLPYQD